MNQPAQIPLLQAAGVKTQSFSAAHPRLAAAFVFGAAMFLGTALAYILFHPFGARVVKLAWLGAAAAGAIVAPQISQAKPKENLGELATRQGAKAVAISQLAFSMLLCLMEVTNPGDLLLAIIQIPLVTVAALVIGGLFTFPCGITLTYFLFRLQTTGIQKSQVLGCGSHLHAQVEKGSD